MRAGYGRFYDKTHFELIGGLFTATPFTSSFTREFPLTGADPNPRQGLKPTDPLLVNGPVLNRALVDSLFPPGSLLRNTGASWDSPDRLVPRTDQLSIGYQHQLGARLSVSADYVHAAGRDMLMSLQLNPTLRATTAVTSPNIRQSSATLDAATAQLQQKYGPSFTPFTGGVTVPLNEGETDYDALMMQLDKRFSSNYSARVSYTLAKSHGNTSGAGVVASGFQVLDDMHLELNEGPTNFDQRHNLVVSGTALIPKTGGLNFSWVARALSGTPFSLTNGNIDQDRNGTIAEPLAAGDYSGTGADAYTVKAYKAERNGAFGPGFFQADLAGRVSVQPRWTAPAQRVRRLLQRHQPGELREPERQPGESHVPRADCVQHELHAAEAAARRAVRVLDGRRRFRSRSRRRSSSSFQ